MNSPELKRRTKRFALRTIRLAAHALPRSIARGDAGLLSPWKTSALRDEANQLAGVAGSSIRTARARPRNPQSAVRNPPSR